MRKPGPSCVTTALPNDLGTLIRGRTLAPAERHKHSVDSGNAKRLLHRLRALQKGEARLHDDYRRAMAEATARRKTRQPGKKHSGLTGAPPKLATQSGSVPPGPSWIAQEERKRKEETDELWETIQEAARAVVPAAWDVAKEKGIPYARRLLEGGKAELEEICDDIVQMMIQMYETAERLHMSPFTRASGRSLTSLWGLGDRLIARCEGLIRVLEGLEKGFEYGGPVIVVLDWVTNMIELVRALRDHNLHDGGRTVAFHITQIVILSFVGAIAIMALIFAAMGLTFELATFGSLLGICALPLAFLKPAKGYQSPFEKAVTNARASGHTYSREYMEAVHKYLHDPSPINRIDLDHIEHGM